MINMGAGLGTVLGGGGGVTYNLFTLYAQHPLDKRSGSLLNYCRSRNVHPGACVITKGPVVVACINIKYKIHPQINDEVNRFD